MDSAALGRPSFACVQIAFSTRSIHVQLVFCSSVILSCWQFKCIVIVYSDVWAYLYCFWPIESVWICFKTWSAASECVTVDTLLLVTFSNPCNVKSLTLLLNSKFDARKLRFDLRWAISGKLSRCLEHLSFSRRSLCSFDSDVVGGADVIDVDDVSIFRQCDFFNGRLPLNDADDILDLFFDFI